MVEMAALRPGLRTNYGCCVSFIKMNGHGELSIA